MVNSFQHVNRWGYDAVPCNGPLCAYKVLVADVTPAQRTAFYLSRRNSEVDVTSLYPTRRDIVATSNEKTSAKDLCTEPFGKPELGITKLGVRLYRSPTNDLPPLNDVKCFDCRKDGKNCGTCDLC